ncbi:SAM-dependent methyltransferase [Mycobacterium marseillense]|uniref:class I SAM-dependent methyltransferase n=1 Tax=Mycobacterium marseillense TaxID=701042 RepID=UPI0007FFE15E|nr:methyltransferase domain-containing protein [Mycobacterium marseillense]MCA2265682.1 methyltransferase domain-containing protein [Mycobacterium marseillense]OBJ65258.1 SAM-dependent methyltransferase [Mycobacterium marseillense]
MGQVTDRWRAARVASALYNAAAMNDNVAAMGAKALWGLALPDLLAMVERVSDAPAGAHVLDVPCGGGFAFRGLRPGQDCHYVAADISPDMLRRARSRATQLGVAALMEFTDADVTVLPFQDDTFDLILTFNGLHCLADPHAAVVELARVIKPGGVLRGSTCVRGRGWRQDRFVTALRGAGFFGNTPQAGDVERWLRDSGLDVLVARHSGSVELFEAVRPGT